MSNFSTSNPAAAPAATYTSTSAPSSQLNNPGLPVFANPAAMNAHLVEETKKYELIRNFVGVVRDMSESSLIVETDLFPRDSLDFYSRFNLLELDIVNNAADKALHKTYYNPARGGGQGDYRTGIQEKIQNVVDCLSKFPFTKRAVLTVPFSEKPSTSADHTDTDEAKCLRELHFYIDEVAVPNSSKKQRVLSCTGMMRAQAASIFPKNIHFIGSIMHLVAKRIGGGLQVGEYTHIVTTMVNGR